MRIPCFIVLISLCLSIVTAASANNQSLLIIGDSLSAGYGIDKEQSWASLLQQKLQKMQCNYSVINDSIDGDTSSNGLARLETALADFEPAIVVVALGGNDGLRAITPEAMKENLSRMVDASRDSGAEVLLVGVRLPPNYGEAYISRYRRVFFDIAKECDVQLVPKVLDNVGGVQGLIQPDGIHPNAKAQPIILDNVWAILGPMLDCRVESD